MNAFPSLENIRQAAERIKPYIHRTPVFTCKTLNAITGSELFFKCENFQKIGAFKIRGASNAVFSLSGEEASKGVATHSSGNHAQALSLAARNRGIQAHIVMPENSAAVKVEAVKGYGGKVVFCKPIQEERERTLVKVMEETGSVLVHPYNDYRVIAGQATAAMELLEEVKAPDIVMAPVGGGGLLSGTLLAVQYLSPQTNVIAAEPKNADDAFRSLKEGKIMPSVSPDTIADGLRTSLGDKTFPIISKFVHRIETASEEKITEAMKLTWERMKIIIEPSSAVPLAVILSNPGLFKGKRIGIILSGGNVDLSELPFKKR